MSVAIRIRICSVIEITIWPITFYNVAMDIAPHACPGQDTRNWTFDDIFEAPCAHCGEVLEFYWNDPGRRCPTCNKYTLNPKVQVDLNCAWCNSMQKYLDLPEEEEDPAAGKTKQA
jgi:rRNA maturation protein Nop10